MTIFEGKIRYKIAQAAKHSNRLSGLAGRNLGRKTERIAKDINEEFEKHLITKEIDDGIDAENKSGTLGWVEGNLFSFLGFNIGEDPLADIREELEGIGLNDFTPARIDINSNNTKIYYYFNINWPDEEMMKVDTYLEHLGGSWLELIETGIFGLEFYLFDRERGFNPDYSRSTVAIEAKNRITGKLQKIRSAQFRPKDYLLKILKKYRRELTR